MKVRLRKPDAAPSFPATPHYHTCRACADRHKWTCQDPKCVWTLLLNCPSGHVVDM